MRKTRFRKFSAGIYHTILKKAKSTFVPGFLILPNEQCHNFCLVTRGDANRYPTVRLGAPAKLKNLHSKIGRRVDLARVRYGTMQSERRRGVSKYGIPTLLDSI